MERDIGNFTSLVVILVESFAIIEIGSSAASTDRRVYNTA
jgi:hypothetical protein